MLALVHGVNSPDIADRLRLRDMVDTVWYWYGERARKAQSKNSFDHRGADLLVTSTKVDTLTWMALHLNEVRPCHHLINLEYL